MKNCKKCGSTDFYTSGKCNCKACARARSAAWNMANPDKKRAADAAYRAANPEKVLANNLAYRTANPDKARECGAKWYVANSWKVKVSTAKWKAENPDKVKTSKAKSYAANPEANLIHWHNRQARKLANGGKLSKGLTARLLNLQRGMCPGCKQALGDTYHHDHRMPLALGGSNTDDNIQLLCVRCNLSKGAKHPVEFMQSRGFLL